MVPWQMWKRLAAGTKCHAYRPAIHSCGKISPFRNALIQKAFLRLSTMVFQSTLSLSFPEAPRSRVVDKCVACFNP
jgi:hypothetical protein